MPQHQMVDLVRKLVTWHEVAANSSSASHANTHNLIFLLDKLNVRAERIAVTIEQINAYFRLCLRLPQNPFECALLSKQFCAHPIFRGHARTGLPTFSITPSLLIAFPIINPDASVWEQVFGPPLLAGTVWHFAVEYPISRGLSGRLRVNFKMKRR